MENHTMMDIYLSQYFPFRTIKSTLSNILGYRNEDAIQIGDSIPLNPLSAACKLLLVSMKTSGDMKVMLQLYFQYKNKVKREDLAIELCKTLNCFALVSDDNVDHPDAVIIFSPTGELSKAMLDSDALDQDRYIIDKY